MTTEIVYLDHDNSIDLILKADGTARDLSNVTKITATFDDTTIESEDAAAGPIRWNQDGYATGEIRLFLGDQNISADRYSTVYIVTYDPDNTNGIVWGSIRVEVKAEVEGT